MLLQAWPVELRQESKSAEVHSHQGYFVLRHSSCLAQERAIAAKHHGQIGVKPGRQCFAIGLQFTLKVTEPGHQSPHFIDVPWHLGSRVIGQQHDAWPVRPALALLPRLLWALRLNHQKIVLA
jgi:hypothetical protein